MPQILATMNPRGFRPKRNGQTGRNEERLKLADALAAYRRPSGSSSRAIGLQSQRTQNEVAFGERMLTAASRE